MYSILGAGVVVAGRRCLLLCVGQIKLLFHFTAISIPTVSSKSRYDILRHNYQQPGESPSFIPFIPLFVVSTLDMETKCRIDIPV